MGINKQLSSKVRLLHVKFDDMGLSKNKIKSRDQRDSMTSISLMAMRQISLSARNMTSPPNALLWGSAVYLFHFYVKKTKDSIEYKTYRIPNRFGETKEKIDSNFKEFDDRKNAKSEIKPSLTSNVTQEVTEIVSYGFLSFLIA